MLHQNEKRRKKSQLMVGGFLLAVEQCQMQNFKLLLTQRQVESKKILQGFIGNLKESNVKAFMMITECNINIFHCFQYSVVYRLRLSLYNNKYNAFDDIYV